LNLHNKEEFVRKIRNIDAKGFTWLPEPGNNFTNKYFATDNVEMFNNHSEHSSRLAISAEINPSIIGNMSKEDKIFLHNSHDNCGGINSQHSGLSHQVTAYIENVSKMIDTGAIFIEADNYFLGVCSDTIKSVRSFENPLNIEVQNSLSGMYFHQTGTRVDDDTTTIKVSASAGYPFAEPGSPNIDFALEIKIYKNYSSKSIQVNVKGFHNDFPAYELIIGNRIVYSHNPSDYCYTGPSFANLWKSRSFNKTEWIPLDNLKK